MQRVAGLPAKWIPEPLIDSAAMANAPIGLIQWLRPNEYRETRDALRCFAEEVDMYHSDVLTKAEAKEALLNWFEESRPNCQFCFLGAHGITNQIDSAIGIGASDHAEQFVDWSELWNWFEKGTLIGGLWLGACRSSDAAAELSPFLAQGGHLAIPYIYGFKNPIYPTEIKDVLVKLIQFTRLDRFPFLDEELEVLRTAVPGTAIELFYPACTKDGTTEYVNTDKMQERVGLSFRQLLEQNHSNKLDRPVQKGGCRSSNSFGCKATP